MDAVSLVARAGKHGAQVGEASAGSKQQLTQFALGSDNGMATVFEALIVQREHGAIAVARQTCQRHAEQRFVERLPLAIQQ